MKKTKETSRVTWPDTMNTAHMSDTELRLYRKRTGPLFDIAFIRQMRPDLAEQLDVLPLTMVGARRAFRLARTRRAGERWSS